MKEEKQSQGDIWTSSSDSVNGDVQFCIMAWSARKPTTRSPRKVLIILGEHYYVTFTLCHRSSACHLSMSYLLRTQKDEFLAIFSPSNSIRTRAVCAESVEKFKGVLGDRAS